MPEEKVSTGTILIMRDEFERVASDKNKLDAVRHRAQIMIQILDELLARREKEGPQS